MKIKLFIILLYTLFSIQHGWTQSLKNKDPYFKIAETLKNTNLQGALTNYQKSLEYWTKKKDSTAMIRSLAAMSKIYNHQTNYNKSYDNYWKALLIAEKTNSKRWQARIHQDLAFLYSFYERDSLALKHYSISLNINKSFPDANKAKNRYILGNYVALTRFYRIQKNIKRAKQYLDSCNIMYQKINDSKKNYYLEVERACFLAFHEDDLEEGEKLILECKDFFENENKSYLIVIYNIIGKIHKRKREYQKSEAAFLKSLEYLNEYKNHKNYELYNYEDLTQIYVKTNRFKKAYAFNNRAKVLNQKIFGSKSNSNKDLFALKDRYRIEKEKQVLEAHQNKLKELENQHSINILKQVILLGSLIFIVLFGFVFIRNLRLKHQSEKVLIGEKQKVELEKQKEIIDVKNKELTSSALQLIEKEEFINQLEKKLSNTNEKTDLRTIRNMVKSATTNPTNNWQEFEARFIDINENFFDKLKAKYPNLGPTDLKVCSLIKLNFSSKEMSSLLGISIESVHTSRYRIRKKIGLERNDNLSDFINNI
ncbi:helix-turn-helix transcriptional regulator [Wenyingzhuangia sp. IMCC45574]